MPLRPGNRKLGKLLHHWSILSGLASICVGASELCLMFCYALQHHYLRPSVKKALRRNYKATLRRNFPQSMTKQIRTEFARIVRIHASGEFYSEEYVRKWIDIANRNPSVLFFSYTRSWREPAMLPVLREMSRLPNVIMWWSCDRETGAPPRTKGVRRAYMMTTDYDIPKFRVDLIFRTRPKTVLKWVNGTLVCPEENGITQTTCSQCQLCFHNNPMPRKKTDVERHTDNARQRNLGNLVQISR